MRVGRASRTCPGTVQTCSAWATHVQLPSKQQEALSKTNVWSVWIPCLEARRLCSDSSKFAAELLFTV